MNSVLDRYPNYEVVVGIEVHAQLSTKTKIFCSCPNGNAPKANAHVCPVCTAQPGTLPVFNEKVAEYAVRLGLATESVIAPTSQFARKHYFYPDLPKNYQITQSSLPICTDGYVPIRLEDGSIKNIRLMRIHIEEDAGKNIHTSTGESLVDLNRAGTPLLEIVTYPDLSSTYEVKTYLMMLRRIVQYLDICSGNMEEGAFRADTNISVRKKGDPKYGIRVELKNINSFKFIADAVEYEIERHIELIEAGIPVQQETRLWDPKKGITVVMRSKEDAPDYRYVEDPDLLPLHIKEEFIAQVAQKMPELPHQKFNRFIQEYNLLPYEAEILVDDLTLAHYYEQARNYTTSKQLVHWILRDLLGHLKETKTSLAQCAITPHFLAIIVDLLEQRVINNIGAKELFLAVASTGKNPEQLLHEMGLTQIGSKEELETVVQEIITQSPTQVAQYKGGNERLFGFFVGQAMAKTKGKADPQIIQELFKKYLSQ